MLTIKLLVSALFTASVSAYSDRSPVVAWSSQRSNVLETLPSNFVVQDIVYSDNICDHDAVILVDQPGLHASDLRSLHPSSHFAKRLNGAASSVQLAYTRNSDVSFADLAQSISARCNSRMITITPGSDEENFTPGSKHVACMTMDSLHTTSGSRKSHMTEQESRLAKELGKLSSKFPNHLVIYSSSHSSNFFRRQSEIDPAFNSPFAPNTTLAEGGILKRYQLLTPALITSLLVVFFVLVPIIMVGINALSSIQSPIRTEPPKFFNARDKKNQ